MDTEIIHLSKVSLAYSVHEVMNIKANDYPSLHVQIKV